MNLIPLFVRRRIAHRPKLLKIVDNLGWLFIDKVLRMGVGLLVGVWVARYLGPEQFGLFSFALAFVGIFGALSGLGIQSIVVRDIVRNPSCKNETLGSAGLLLFAGGLLAYGCTVGVIFWLRPEDDLTKILVAIVGSTLIIKFSDVALYWFESQVLSKYIVWVQNICFLIFTGIKIGLIISNAPLIAFACATAAEAILVAFLVLTLLGIHGTKVQQLRFTKQRVKTLLTDSWPLLLSSMAIMVYMKIDQIMLGQMLGNNAVGIYSVAVRISEVWYFVPMIIVASVFPAILEAKNHDESQYLQKIQRLYELMVLFSIIIALPITFLSETIVISLFSSVYAESASVLAIHIWTSVFVFLGVASNQCFIIENRQILSLQRALLGVIINVGLNLIWIPKYGVIGAAIATAVAQASVCLFFDFFQKETRQMFYMKLKSLNLVNVISKFFK